MNKKILIGIIIIAVLLLGAAVYFELSKEKKPVDILKQRLESVSVKLDSFSSKASELKNLASKAEAKLQGAGETDKVQACQEAIALLDEISGRANELSQRTKQMKEDIEAVEKAKIPKEAKTSLVLELKQLRIELINFRQELGKAKQDILNYAETIKDSTNIREALQFADKLKKFTKNIDEVEKEINQTTSGIDEYISVLHKGPTKPTKLSQVKVASLYERVTDGKVIDRNVDDVIELLKDTKTDFIFRGLWRFLPCPESQSDSSGFFTSEQLAKAAERGYTYEHLRTAIRAIKEAVPDVIFCGAIGAQFMNAREKNPITGEVFDRDETWGMALDPGKWGIAMSKYEFQESFAKTQHWIGSGEAYDPDKVGFYFPDLTNPDFQELFLSWAEKQIDCGADAIWIDFLFSQANGLEKITGDPYHPAVKESYDAAIEIVDKIHKYGYSKYGKYIYVGSWAGAVKLPYTHHNLDFVTVTPSSKEIINKTLDNEKWGIKTAAIREKLGDVPIFAFIDWADDNAPTAVFSQKLTPAEQREFLIAADEFFTKKGIKFVYPIHGGFMGPNAKTLSFGKYKTYDSLAPEFQTYETIKELAQKKASKIPVTPFPKPTKLSQVKVASQYRRVTDGEIIGRDLDDVIEILKETRTDFIFQGWMRQLPCPETCSDLSPGEEENCEKSGYSYEHLRNAISKIKEEIPDVIFGGGILAEFLNPECWTPLTGETFGRNETWEMALDPNKWGIQMSKEEFQTEWAIGMGWTKNGQPYNPKEQMPFYFPDLTNPDFKELFLSFAKKQIDSGVDLIWIDMLYAQQEILKRITGDVNHPAVKESYEAASEIVDEIHKYGYSQGKYVYVITWAQNIMFHNSTPNLDAVMVTISSEEVSSMSLDEEKWESAVRRIREKFGDIPIFVRIDYGTDRSPLAVFSQNLSKEEQSEFLRIADEFFQEKGMIFIYPLHGGNMGRDAKILSYGKYNWYDSLAPEFQTYETIKELANKKASE